MTLRGSSWYPRVRKVSARATRSGVRSRPSRSGSGSMARRMAVTCASRSSRAIFGALTDGVSRGKATASAAHQAIPPQVLEDRARRRRLVEGVEVDAGRASPQELRALPRAILDAEGHPGDGVVACSLEGGRELGRHRVARQLRDALDLPRVGDRHDAGHEGHGDARTPRPLDEAEVELVVVEELGDDDVEPRVNLHLEVLDAELEVTAL